MKEKGLILKIKESIRLSNLRCLFALDEANKEFLEADDVKKVEMAKQKAVCLKLASDYLCMALNELRPALTQYEPKLPESEYVYHVFKRRITRKGKEIIQIRKATWNSYLMAIRYTEAEQANYFSTYEEAYNRREEMKKELYK